MQTSPTAWAELPKELQRLVFSHMTVKTLLQLQLTCKAFRHVAEEFLYKIIDIRLTAKSIATEQNLIATLELQDNQTRFFVKMLFLRPIHVNEVAVQNKNYANLLQRFLIACPNLTSVYNGMIPRPEYYQIVASLRREGYLQKVEDFSGIMAYVEHSESYNNTAVDCANTLQNLVLLPDPEISTLASNTNAIDAYALGKHLGEFVCLHKLTIQLPNNVELRALDQLLDDTPHSLKHLGVIFQDSSAKFERIQKFQVPQDGRALSNLNNVFIDGMSIFTDQDMLFMVRRFPDLKQLVLKFDLSHADPTLRLETVQSSSVVCNFMVYMAQQKLLCSIKCFATTHQIMTNIIAQLSKIAAVKKMNVSACHAENTDYPDFTLIGTLLFQKYA